MERTYKVIVAHPGRQHSFKLASALKKEKKFEVTYITTVYDKKQSIIMRILKKTFSNSNSKRINNRKNSDFSDKEIIQFCQIGGLIEILLNRLEIKKLTNIWHKKVSARFGIKVAKFAIKNHFDAVISYDTNAMECFSYLKYNAPHIHRIMDASAANRLFMKDIYQKDMVENKCFSEKLFQEIGNNLSEERIKYLQKEILYSQYILAASKFVELSYQHSGFLKDNIKICPYGVEINDFQYIPKKTKLAKETIEFVFVGGTKQIKGISYLLDAFLQIPKGKARLTIVGNCNLPEHLLKKYQKNINFTGFVNHDKISGILEKMDVMIFPSLGDGFGLSAIEGMSSGCPLICSHNSGIADLIDEGKNGFTVPIQDCESIIYYMKWFIEHRDMIPRMGKEAHETAKNFNWERYDINIINSVKSILKTERSERYKSESIIKKLYL